MNHQDPLMRKAEVAQTLKCSERTLERLVCAGHFPPPLNHGKQALWFESVVQAWLQRQREAQLAWAPRDTQLYQPDLSAARSVQEPVVLAIAAPSEGFVPRGSVLAAQGKAEGRTTRRPARAAS